MNKFKPGDVVKCVDNAKVENDLKIGWLYTISKVVDNLIILKEREFDTYGGFIESRFELVERGYRAPQPTTFNPSGQKYLRDIKTTPDGKIDVYAVLIAFNVVSPARQHAIKKLLCAGIRGKNNEINDLEEARDAIIRDIELL